MYFNGLLKGTYFAKFTFFHFFLHFFGLLLFLKTIKVILKNHLACSFGIWKMSHSKNLLDVMPQIRRRCTVT